MNFEKNHRVSALLLLSLLPLAARAAPARAEGRPTIVVTLPTLGALVREVAGDAVEVQVLARGDEDPHFVQPTPLLMRRAKDAGAFFEVGLGLELWADNVTSGLGNANIQRGAKGRVSLADGVPTLEVPTRIDAAQGDIHPQGNPHVWLDPVRAKRLARNAEQALSRLYPEQAAVFQENLKRFELKLDEAFYGKELLALVGATRLDRALLSGRLPDLLEKPFKGATLGSRAGGWLKKGARLRGLKVFEYHKVWAYFAQAFGFEIVGTVETYPGIRPGPGHLEAVIQQMKAQKIPLILVDNFYQKDIPEHVARAAGARYVMLPDQVGGEPDVKDYFQLIDRILDKILAALPKAP